MKVLHVAAEIFPLIKTGGLADVAYALPRAEYQLRQDVRLLLPGYPSILKGIKNLKTIAELGVLFNAARVRVKQGQFPGSNLVTYVVDAPSLFCREGNPYTAPEGGDWPDNHRRFGLLAWVAAHMAAGEIDFRFKPDIVHAHDWHAGLTPAYMAEIPGLKAKSVFTIHNLAYRGLFPYDYVLDLMFTKAADLPLQFEFYGKIAFLKAGIVFADKVTTVSPTYTREVLTEEKGFGLHGVLAQKAGRFEGILNGLDYDVWNPANDASIVATYDVKSLSGKKDNKKALLDEFKLMGNDKPLFGVVSRLADQKGLDIMLQALPELLKLDANFVLLGSGDKTLEEGFKNAARNNPDRIGVFIGYDENLSHKLVAGADALIVPSRFEPCGLTQMMALRYGTLPVVRQTGGLADSVQEVDGETGDGFTFRETSKEALVGALRKAVSLYKDKAAWQKAQVRAMKANFSWENSAKRYLALYEGLLH